MPPQLTGIYPNAKKQNRILLIKVRAFCEIGASKHQNTGVLTSLFLHALRGRAADN